VSTERRARSARPRAMATPWCAWFVIVSRFATTRARAASIERDHTPSQRWPSSVKAVSSATANRRPARRPSRKAEKARRDEVRQASVTLCRNSATGMANRQREGRRLLRRSSVASFRDSGSGTRSRATSAGPMVMSGPLSNRSGSGVPPSATNSSRCEGMAPLTPATSDPVVTKCAPCGASRLEVCLLERRCVAGPPAVTAARRAARRAARLRSAYFWPPLGAGEPANKRLPFSNVIVEALATRAPLLAWKPSMTSTVPRTRSVFFHPWR